VDDRLIGELPLSGPLRLAAGKHTVVLTHPMFEPIVRSVTVTAGGRETVHGNFLSSAGYLRCSASPWAEVFVDGQYKETTPFAKPIMLSAGVHRVRFHHSAFPDITREVTIVPHDTATLTVSFSR
jgi:hypothetical protein